MEPKSMSPQKRWKKTPAGKLCKKRWRQKPRNKLIRAAKRRLAKYIRTYTMSLRTSELIGCSPDFWTKWIESKFKAGMSWDNYGQWHIDHIVPCCRFNLMDTDEQRKCFHYSNTQPLWKGENLAKHHKLDKPVQQELPVSLS